MSKNMNPNTGMKFILITLIFYCVSAVVKIKLMRHTPCVSIDSDVLSVYNLSLEQCAKTCTLRVACAGVTYKRAGRKCTLFLSDESLHIFSLSLVQGVNGDFDGGQCVFIRRNDIQLGEILPTPGCRQKEEYDTGTGRCVVRECPNMFLTHGVIYGNIQRIGNRIMYTCKFGNPSRKTSVCSVDGVWEPDPPCNISCLQYLVPGIPDGQLSASSSYSALHEPDRGRLDITEVYLHNSIKSSGCWAAKEKANSYIQAEFPDEMIVNAVVTKGRDGRLHNQYVKTYTVAYSVDCTTFVNVKAKDGTMMVFVGNTDTTTESVQYLPDPILAKCVRLYPKTYHNHVSMRFDIIGCSRFRDTICPESPRRIIKPNIVATFQIQIQPDNYTLADANAKCMEMKGTLVDLSVHEIYTYVTTLLKNCTGSVRWRCTRDTHCAVDTTMLWLYIAKTDTHLYHFIACYIILMYAGCKRYWIGSTGTSKCASTPSNGSQLGIQEDLNCGGENGYICQWTLP